MRVLILLKLFIFLCLAPLVQANAILLPMDIARPLQLLGKGELKYYGFHVYDASLWTVHAVAFSDNDSYALQIRYARDIEKGDLLGKTREAWLAQQLWDERSEQWLRELSTIWPTVREGDVLVFYRSPTGEAQFYLNGKVRGTISDPAFAQYFSAIWLDETAEFDELRQQLLGLSN